MSHLSYRFTAVEMRKDDPNGYDIYLDITETYDEPQFDKVLNQSYTSDEDSTLILSGLSQEVAERLAAEWTASLMREGIADGRRNG